MFSFLLLLRLTDDFSLNEFEDEDLSELTEMTDQYHEQVGEMHHLDIYKNVTNMVAAGQFGNLW